MSDQFDREYVPVRNEKMHQLLQYGSYPFQLFTYCLLGAADRSFTWQEQTLEPGQLGTSYWEIMEALGLQLKEIRPLLETLRDGHELSFEETSSGLVITISNWSQYDEGGTS